MAGVIDDFNGCSVSSDFEMAFSFFVILLIYFFMACHVICVMDVYD